MSIILVILSIYLISFGIAWFYFKSIHSKNGKEHDTPPSSDAILLTICPVVNTIVVFWWIFFFPFKIKRNTKRPFSQRFFRYKQNETKTT